MNPTKMKLTYLLCALSVLTLLLACETGTGGLAPSKQKVEMTDEFAAYPGQDTNSYRPLFLHPIPSEDVINSNQTPYGAYGQLLLPPTTDARIQLLNEGIWTIEFYIDEEADARQRMFGTGQWMQFFPDGHFIGGHWQRQTHSGAYYVNLGEKYPMITFDSNVDQLDATWEMQRIADDRENMAWRRADEKNFGPKRRNIVLKLNKLDNRPTREQYDGILSRYDEIVD